MTRKKINDVIWCDLEGYFLTESLNIKLLSIHISAQKGLMQKLNWEINSF